MGDVPLSLVVVVPARNEERRLNGCLLALRAAIQHFGPDAGNAGSGPHRQRDRLSVHGERRRVDHPTAPHLSRPKSR